MNLITYKNKKIGIWGFGKTGQSVLAFIASDAQAIFIFELQELSQEQKDLVKKYNATVLDKTLFTQFLELCDIIIPSPGIDLQPYALIQEKFVSELDIFAQHVTTKTIAITGSVGKTTIVTLLTELLNRCGIKSCAAGNIGKPMLDVLAVQNEYEWIVLELSSFQLEHSHFFAPTIAAITNLFPNHLDRHKTLEHYAQAKSHIFKQQTEEQWLIIPQTFFEYFIDFTKQQKVFWLADDAYKQNITSELSDTTFDVNWNSIFAILETIGLDIELIKKHCSDLSIPEHRLELIKNENNITFYNDSKATIPAATLESLKKLKKYSSIILFIGGVSKGVDRTDFIKALPKTLKHVLCFGAQADFLDTLCKKRNISSSSHTTLESAWIGCKALMQPGDIILFSPAGASFDLFKNYEERGNCFKKLVLNL